MLCSIVFNFLTFVTLSRGQTLKENIYTEIQNIRPCFRRMNSTNVIGCTSEKGGNVGVLMYVETLADFHRLRELEEFAPFIILVDPYILRGPPAHFQELRVGDWSPAAWHQGREVEGSLSQGRLLRRLQVPLLLAAQQPRPLPRPEPVELGGVGDNVGELGLPHISARELDLHGADPLLLHRAQHGAGPGLAPLRPGADLQHVRGPGLGHVSPQVSAANRSIGEVVQSRRRPLLGPSPG